MDTEAHYIEPEPEPEPKPEPEPPSTPRTSSKLRLEPAAASPQAASTPERTPPRGQSTADMTGLLSPGMWEHMLQSPRNTGENTNPSAASWNPFVRPLDGHRGRVKDCCFFGDDSTKVLSCADDNTLMVWNLEDPRTDGGQAEQDSLPLRPGSPPLELGVPRAGEGVRLGDDEAQHTHLVRACVGYKDGPTWKAISCSADKSFKVWDLDAQELLFTVDDAHDDWIMECCAFQDQDSREWKALTCASDKRIKLWNVSFLEEALPRGSFKSAEAAFRKVDVDRSGSIGRREVKQALLTREVLRELGLSREQVTRSFLDEAMKEMDDGGDGEVSLGKFREWWEKQLIKQSVRELSRDQGHSDWVMGLTTYYDKHQQTQFALSSSADFSLKLWRLDSCMCVQTFTGHAGWINCCRVFKSWCRATESYKWKALSGCDDRTLRIWDLSGSSPRRCELTLRGHTGEVIACDPYSQKSASQTYGPTKPRAISCSADKTIRLWDLITVPPPPPPTPTHPSIPFI
eukprot:COSAG04_NODE_199_length_20482_cov_32.401559_1_plen_515_part_00